jgi:hypothetical protein
MHPYILNVAATQSVQVALGLPVGVQGAHLNLMKERGCTQLSKVLMIPKPWSSKLSKRFIAMLRFCRVYMALLQLAAVLQ